MLKNKFDHTILAKSGSTQIFTLMLNIDIEINKKLKQSLPILNAIITNNRYLQSPKHRRGLLDKQ